MLDYEALDLKPFYAGALVRLQDGSFHRYTTGHAHRMQYQALLSATVQQHTAVSDARAHCYQRQCITVQESTLRRGSLPRVGRQHSTS